MELKVLLVAELLELSVVVVVLGILKKPAKQSDVLQDHAWRC